MNEEEKVYYEHEIYTILRGLLNVYWSRPWYTRWLFKPWHDAIMTTIAIICGERIMLNHENEQLSKSISNYLDDL